MKLFSPSLMGDFEMVSGETFDDIMALNGVPEGGWETPPRMIFLRDSPENPRATCPFNSGFAFIVREEALSAAKEILSPWGQFFPVPSDEGTLYYFEPTHSLDALDEERSEIIYFDTRPKLGEPRKIMRIKRMVVKESTIGNVQVFRLARKKSLLYFQESVVAALWGAAELTGTDFHHVYPR